MGLQEGGDVQDRGGDRRLGLDQGQKEQDCSMEKLDMGIIGMLLPNRFRTGQGFPDLCLRGLLESKDDQGACISQGDHWGIGMPAVQGFQPFNGMRVVLCGLVNG